jgi:hypothetical protein
MNEFLNSGFTMVAESDFSVRFSKPMEGMGGVMYQALLGNAYSSTPNWYVDVNMTTIGEQTRVLAQATVHMQNAFGREDVQDFTHGKAGQQLMTILERVRAQVEANK